MNDNKKYKTLYVDLAHVLNGLKISVRDYDLFGYCWRSSDDPWDNIIISPKLNFKEKYFCLAHEAGHLFYMKKGKVFNKSKETRTEKQANRFAIQLLKFNDINSREYSLFYNKAVKRNKNRKKSWFEI